MTPPPDRSWAALPDDVVRTGSGRTGSAGATLLEVTWPDDRQVATAWFARLAVSVDADGPMDVAITDGRGITHLQAAKDGAPVEVGAVAGPPPQDAPLHGLARLAVTAAAEGTLLRSVTVDYIRPRPEGLLSRYGIRSTHPLDGKVPTPGAPTHYWSGTVWAPYAWHAVEALRAHGEEELGVLMAEAFCAGVKQSYAFGIRAPEHHCEHTGIGMGCPDQAWTAGVALLLDDVVRADGRRDQQSRPGDEGDIA
jgi:glycogen debranching enzyme